MEAISGLTLQPTKSHGFRRCAQKVAPYYIFGFLMFLGGFKASNPPEINEICYGPPVHVKFHPPPPSTPFKGGAIFLVFPLLSTNQAKPHLYAFCWGPHSSQVDNWNWAPHPPPGRGDPQDASGPALNNFVKLLGAERCCAHWWEGRRMVVGKHVSHFCLWWLSG